MDQNIKSLNTRVPLFCFVFLFAALISTSLVGCAKNGSQSPSGDKDPAQKAEVANFDAAEKADGLADEGESLLANYSFHDANGKFAQALVSDPSNSRAIFWRAMLRPTLEMKGVLRRVRPIYQNPAHAKPGQYQELLRGLQDKQPHFQSFLLSGPEDIATPEELQAWMDRYTDSVGLMLEELKKIENVTTVVRVPIEIASQLAASYSDPECEPVSFGPIHYEEEGCHNRKSRRVTLARADVIFMRAMGSYYKLMLDMFTAYRINPASVFTESKINNKAEAEDYYRRLMSAQDSGTLRRPHPFSSAREMSQDIVTGLKYVLNNQDELCRGGFSSFDNRPGHLIPFGFCIHRADSGLSETERTLHAFESFLAGRSVTAFFGEGQTAEIRPERFINQPTASLKNFGDISFNTCGHIEVSTLEPVSHVFETREGYELYLTTFNEEKATRCMREEP